MSFNTKLQSDVFAEQPDHLFQNNILLFIFGKDFKAIHTYFCQLTFK